MESGGPAKTTLMKVNTGFRQLLKTVHPDKLSGCDSRVQNLSSKITAWLNEERTTLELTLH